MERVISFATSELEAFWRAGVTWWRTLAIAAFGTLCDGRAEVADRPKAVR